MCAKEGVEGGGYYYCWEEKWNGGEGAEESLAAEVEAGKEDGGGDAEEEREEGGKSGLVKGEEYYVLRIAQVFGSEGRGRKCEGEDLGKWKEESEGEEGERDEPEENSFLPQSHREH